MEFSNYKFRCSALGKIISKSGKLTDGNKTYLNQLFSETIYNFKREIRSIAMDKGNLCEDDGFGMLNEVYYKGRFVSKVKETKENEFIKGTADTIIEDTVIDIKNALDPISFENATLTWDYEWQLRGYMMLYGVDNARLFYCLNNMPYHLILELQRKHFYQNNHRFTTMDSPEYLDECDIIEKQNNFDHLPIYEKFKAWELKKELDLEDRIKESVLIAREYLVNLQIERNERINNNKAIFESIK